MSLLVNKSINIPYSVYTLQKAVRCSELTE